MTQEALYNIVLHELGLIEEELTQNERIKIACEVAFRLLCVPLNVPQKPD